jgi:hypothetical protein
LQPLKPTSIEPRTKAEISFLIFTKIPPVFIYGAIKAFVLQ